MTHAGHGVTVFRRKDEQSAVAEDGKGFALVARTARRQLSALQTSFFSSTPPGKARADVHRGEIRSATLENILNEWKMSKLRKTSTEKEGREKNR